VINTVAETGKTNNYEGGATIVDSVPAVCDPNRLFFPSADREGEAITLAAVLSIMPSTW
jgi:hypothetical protein